jgi:hypothetical protein
MVVSLRKTMDKSYNYNIVKVVMTLFFVQMLDEGYVTSISCHCSSENQFSIRIKHVIFSWEYTNARDVPEYVQLRAEYIYIYIYIYIYFNIQSSVFFKLTVLCFSLYEQAVTNKQLLFHPVLPFEVKKDDDSNNSQDLNHHQL